MKHTTTAVVTGADHPTGLGGGRALALAGATCWGLASNPQAPAARSSVWQQLIQTARRDRWVDQLLSVASGTNQPLFLLPIQDLAVREISHRRLELETAYRFVLPDDETVAIFLEKTRFYDWAKPRGYPVPASRSVCSEAELVYAVRAMPFPMIVKPLIRTDAWNRASPVQKAYRLDNPTDMNRLPADLFSLAPAYLVSQWIEGPDSSVHFCLGYRSRSGKLEEYYTGKKLLQYPRRTGSTAICVTTENMPLRELTAQLFAEADFCGLGSLEVKYAADRLPYITEPTVGRPNLQSHSAVLAGSNLVGLALADATDTLRTTANNFANTAKRRSFWVDESAIIELTILRSPGIPWRLVLNELTHAAARGGAYWSLADIRPFLALMKATLVRLVHKILRRR